MALSSICCLARWSLFPFMEPWLRNRPFLPVGGDLKPLSCAKGLRRRICCSCLAATTCGVIPVPCTVVPAKNYRCLTSPTILQDDNPLLLIVMFFQPIQSRPKSLTSVGAVISVNTEEDHLVICGPIRFLFHLVPKG